MVPRLLPLLLILPTALAAAEQQFEDLRLVAEARPTAFRFAWDDRLGARSGDGAFSQAWGAGAGVRWGWGASGSPHRLLAGAEVLALRQGVDDMTGDGALARAEAGYGHALGEQFALTLMPLAGFGLARLRRDGGASGDLQLRGPAWEAGLRAGLRWSPGAHWSLGGEAGWLYAQQRLRGDDASLRLTSSGAWLGLALAWTLDPEPRGLE